MNLQFFFFAFQFASNGNEEEVEKLLSSGGDHGSPGEKFCHPLCSCAKCEKLHTRYTLWLQLSVFTNVASIYTNLLEQMKRFTWKRKKKKKKNRIGLEHQHAGHRFIVLEHQYGRRDVTWKRS